MKAIKAGSEIRIDGGYMHRESIKQIDGRRYDAGSKAWFIPLSDKNTAMAQILGAELDDELRELLKTKDKAGAESQTPIRKMPIKAKPYKHQVRAFNFALKILCGEGGDANEIQRKA